MKKIFAVVSICLLAFAGTVMAGSPVQVPTVDGNDVLVPDAFIRTVSEDPASDTIVAVFHDKVGPDAEVAMRFDGNNWVIPGGRGADVHPAKKTADGYAWAKIEDVWSTGSDFVKFRGPNRPCLHVD